MADKNFKGGPGGRLQREEENVSFGFMRPTVSPLNQKQFMQVARGEMSPRQTGMNAPVVFGQKPGSIGEKIGQALSLGKKPYPGQGYSLTPSETAKQTAINLAAGEAIGAGVKVAAPYVKPMAKKAVQYITTQTPLRDAYKLNPFAFKPREGYVYRGIGKSGLDDATESGVFKSPYNADKTYWADADQFGYAKNYSKTLDEISPAKWEGNDYGGGEYKLSKSIIAEYPKKQELFYPEYKGQMEDALYSKSLLPMSEGRVLQEDWLRGYKPIKFR
jgi:hypothetical protein